MCGICGFSWEDEGLIQAMNATLHHRGPDDRGHQVGAGASLGQTRLAIIDLSPNGRQPMHNEDRSLWVVVNGEIYNHQDLRRELVAKGHAFYSQSDSEVLLHAYEEWGEDFAKKLIGMFCFALLDGPRGRIVLGRDRLGIKPLYYHHDGTRLIFANEIKAMLTWPGLARRVDPEAFYQYLAGSSSPPPHPLRGDQTSSGRATRLRPESGRFEEKPYWRLGSPGL